jgi:hypothetical protein
MFTNGLLGAGWAAAAPANQRARRTKIMFRAAVGFMRDLLVRGRMTVTRRAIYFQPGMAAGP